MLPSALARVIRLPSLTADQFTPTKWDDGAAKAKFGNHLLRFIAEDFPETLFTQKFYTRLSNTSGHIAHYDRSGFWAEFFTSRASMIAFLEQTMTYPCYGDPTWTYSDVERVIRVRLKQSGILDWHRTMLAQDRVRAERAQYDQLARKYAPPSNAPHAPMVFDTGCHSPPEPRETQTGASVPLPARKVPSRSPANQPDLFAGI